MFSSDDVFIMVTLFNIRSLAAFENLSQNCVQIVLVLFTASYTVVGEENADTAIAE